MRVRLRDDGGNATILAAGVIAALASLTFVLASLGGARLDTHQARLAADLAAVAGAYALFYGEDGCAQSRRVAELNEAILAGCEPDNADIVLTARVGKAEVRARAGPV